MGCAALLDGVELRLQRPGHAEPVLGRRPCGRHAGRLHLPLRARRRDAHLHVVPSYGAAEPQRGLPDLVQQQQRILYRGEPDSAGDILRQLRPAVARDDNCAARRRALHHQHGGPQRALHLVRAARLEPLSLALRVPGLAEAALGLAPAVRHLQRRAWRPRDAVLNHERLWRRRGEPRRRWRRFEPRVGFRHLLRALHLLVDDVAGLAGHLVDGRHGQGCGPPVREHLRPHGLGLLRPGAAEPQHGHPVVHWRQHRLLGQLRVPEPARHDLPALLEPARRHLPDAAQPVLHGRERGREHRLTAHRLLHADGLRRRGPLPHRRKANDRQPGPEFHHAASTTHTQTTGGPCLQAACWSPSPGRPPPCRYARKF